MHGNTTPQVDTTDMEHSFMFSTNFQSAVAVAKNMMPVIAALTLDPDFLEDLRNEIDGKVTLGLPWWSVWVEVDLRVAAKELAVVGGGGWRRQSRFFVAWL